MSMSFCAGTVCDGTELGPQPLVVHVDTPMLGKIQVCSANQPMSIAEIITKSELILPSRRGEFCFRTSLLLYAGDTNRCFLSVKYGLFQGLLWSRFQAIGPDTAVFPIPASLQPTEPVLAIPTRFASRWFNRFYAQVKPSGSSLRLRQPSAPTITMSSTRTPPIALQ